MTAEHSLRETVRFGVFEADFRAGELRNRGIKIKLQEQPLQILQMLLEHPGEIVTRDELRQKIWPADTFVDFEQGLYNSVRRLRDALGDSADSPRFIETLARRGYRFIGAIDVPSRSIEALAVLPLENLSSDPEQDYFSDGLTESLITTRAKIFAGDSAGIGSRWDCGRYGTPIWRPGTHHCAAGRCLAGDASMVRDL